jgi:hypothetical protein
LYLTGMAGKMLKKEIPLEKNIPPPLIRRNWPDATDKNYNLFVFI